MICNDCVEILIKEMHARSSNPVNCMANYCLDPKKCECKRLRECIEKYILPNRETKNEYAFLKKLGENVQSNVDK